MAQALFAPIANEDALEAWSYISRFTDTRADGFLDSLKEKCQTLAEMPNMGRARPEFGEAVRSFPFGNFVIYYRPVEGNIEVLRVLRAARDLDALTILPDEIEELS